MFCSCFYGQGVQKNITSWPSGLTFILYLQGHFSLYLIFPISLRRHARIVILIMFLVPFGWKTSGQWIKHHDLYAWFSQITWIFKVRQTGRDDFISFLKWNNITIGWCSWYQQLSTQYRHYRFQFMQPDFLKLMEHIQVQQYSSKEASNYIHTVTFISNSVPHQDRKQTEVLLKWHTKRATSSKANPSNKLWTIWLASMKIHELIEYRPRTKFSKT